jgi:dihydroflavonol-4-reductase
MSGKLALITGAAGYSAPWVIEKLLEQGWKVRATDLIPGNLSQRFGDKVEFMSGNLTKPETLKTLLADVDIVFHPAAVFSYSAPMDLLRKVNVEGTKNLLDLCLKSQVKKMVLWSSVAVYGSCDPKFYRIPIKELPMDQINPRSEGKYDISKREQEIAARKYWDENKFPISFMRLAPLYGSGSYYGMYALFRYIYEEVLSICPSNLGYGKGSIPMVHSEDVARAAIHLSDPTKYNGESYNVADDYTLDMIETISYIANLTHSKFRPIIPMPMKVIALFFSFIGKWSLWEAQHLKAKIDGKPPLPGLESDLLVYLNGNYRFDNSKLKSTGFEFKWADRKIGLADVIDWYNKNGWYKRMTIKGLDQIQNNETQKAEVRN